MVAIVVILAAIIAAYSFGLFSEQKTAPQASVRILSADTSANTLTLEHQGGADIILSYIKIIVEQGGNRMSYDPAGNSSSRLTAGDRMQVNTTPAGIFINGNAADYTNSGSSFSIVPGSDVTVTMIDIPSGNQVAALRIKA